MHIKSNQKRYQQQQRLFVAQMCRLSRENASYLLCCVSCNRKWRRLNRLFTTSNLNTADGCCRLLLPINSLAIRHFAFLVCVNFLLLFHVLHRIEFVAMLCASCLNKWFDYINIWRFHVTRVCLSEIPRSWLSNRLIARRHVHCCCCCSFYFAWSHLIPHSSRKINIA